MRIKNKSIKSYISVMETLDMSEAKKQDIIRNCALYATSVKIKSGSYKIVPVKSNEKVI